MAKFLSARRYHSTDGNARIHVRITQSQVHTCAERVSQQIYQSHVGSRLRLHLTRKNSLVKFSNPNEKLVENFTTGRDTATAEVSAVHDNSVWICERDLRQRRVLPSPEFH